MVENGFGGSKDGGVSEETQAKRLQDSVRALWRLDDDDFLQLDHIRDVSAAGAFVLSDAISEPGAVIRFELQDEAGATTAEGSARVVDVEPDEGMRVEFESLSVREHRAPGAPPPLPSKGARPAPVDEWVAPQIEPLDVMGLEEIIIGIDLGTTNTCASWVSDDRPQIVPGRTGGNTIPSMINFDKDGRVHIGQRASDRQVLYPDRTVYGSKRLIGRTWSEELASELQTHFAYPLGEADGQRFGVDLGDRVVSMDGVAAKVLTEVKGTAEDFLGREVHAAVITVPAYFSEVQREAVRRAALMAGLTVRRIVNEPTAAAVAYGHARGEEARIAVWDFGGGTFDFSVVDIQHERYEVVATGGDNFVGGADFDDEVASYILEEFLRQEELEAFEPSPQQIARLRESAEVCKRALSDQTEFDVRLLDFTREPRRELHVTVTRDAFEERTRPLIERAASIAQGVMLSAGIMPTEIDDVVLVGGTTRIPAVQEAVAHLFERKPSKRINPDEAVALGAALLAHEIGSDDAPTLLDILPMTVGHGADGRLFSTVIKRGARLPCDEVLTFEGDLLGMVMVPLFQGESKDVAHNEYLSTVMIEDPRLRDGGRAQIRLTLDEHCVLAVDAFLERDGRPLEVTLDRERPLQDVLAELGGYDGPEVEEEWHLPKTTIGSMFGKLFGFFKRG